MQQFYGFFFDLCDLIIHYIRYIVSMIDDILQIIKSNSHSCDPYTLGIFLYSYIEAFTTFCCSKVFKLLAMILASSQIHSFRSIDWVLSCVMCCCGCRFKKMLTCQTRGGSIPFLRGKKKDVHIFVRVCCSQLQLFNSDISLNIICFN